MKNTFFIFFLFCWVYLGVVSCNRNYEAPAVQVHAPSRIEEAMLKVNKYIARRNRDHIRSFIRRTGWEMEQTGSGLWIMIDHPGTGESAKPGQLISLEYELMLLDGTPIAASSEKGPLKFRIGQGGVESGLEEAAILLRNGSSAKIIIPPHLAYGNFGEAENRIPPDAILLYKLKVLSIL